MAGGHFLQIFVVFVVVGIPLLILTVALVFSRVGGATAPQEEE